MTSSDAAFDPREEVERKIVSGLIAREDVDRARRLWRETLGGGLQMPDGQRVIVSEQDLHHALLDPRIVRKPERIQRLIQNIFEIRTARGTRQLGLSRWIEGQTVISGYAIFDEDGGLRTMHIVDARGLAKKARQGLALWKRDE